MRSITFPYSIIKKIQYYQSAESILLSKRWLSTSRIFKPLGNTYCLTKLGDEWAERQPLKGKKVLLNMHLTSITLAVIDILRKTAEVEVTVSPELVKHDNA